MGQHGMGGDKNLMHTYCTPRGMVNDRLFIGQKEKKKKVSRGEVANFLYLSRLAAFFSAVPINTSYGQCFACLVDPGAR